MLRILYSILITVLLPVIFLRLLLKSRKDVRYRKNWSQRLGLYTLKKEKKIIWVQALSFGETVAISPLIERLLVELPDYQVLITNMTITGVTKTHQHFGDRVLSQFIPYDVPFIMNSFIKRLNPDLVIISETELWPNMLRQCKKMEVPVLVANARLNINSARRYLRAGRMTRDMISAVSIFAVQNTLDYDNFRFLGVPGEKLSLAGNLKFDQPIPENLRDQGLEWKKEFNRPTWIAASTHEIEEKVVLAAHKLLLATYPDLLLILVPRHPERFKVVAKNLSSSFSFARHSKEQFPGVKDQVWLGDTMGNLFAYYAAANLAFVGGSISSTGGHSPLEPAAIGVPVMMGPHVFNCQQIHDQLLELDGLISVTENSLTEVASELLSNKKRRQNMSEAALDWVAVNQGATNKQTELVKKLLKV